MKNKRVGVFETNSSSVHSICIQKEPVTDVAGQVIDFEFGEYGWECDYYYDTPSYLHTAMIEIGMESEFNDLVNKLENEYGVVCRVKEKTGDRYFENGYVDHADKLKELIDMLLANDDMMLKFLLGKNSIIYTGNDNDDIETGSKSEETHYVYWKYN